MHTERNLSYEYMAGHDAVLITGSALSEKINGVTFIPGEKIQFSYFDGEEHTIELEYCLQSDGADKGETSETGR